MKSNKTNQKQYDMKTIAAEFSSTLGVDDAPDIDVVDCKIVAVVLVFNELLRLPAFLDHYRNIGVEKFIFVDNMSTDGTDKYLHSQNDVELIIATAEFKSYKSKGRELLADVFLDGKWVIFPDADELLVYPGWPELSLRDFIKYLEVNGYEALFTSMVDMYPSGELDLFKYQSGENLLEACPYFDSDGYRFNPLKGSHGKKFDTPVRHIFGGLRERVFHTKTKRKRSCLDDIIIKLFYSIKSRAPSNKIQRKVDLMLFKIVKNALPDPAAVQSKVQFVRWSKGYRFSGSVHNIWQSVKLAPDWGALLHFKYLDDFRSKVSEAIERKQHTDNAGHYLDYDSQMDRLMNEGLRYPGSVRFEGVRSLLDCGLMRESAELRAWRKRATGA
jgi:glycosyltransferase involved in cell wall biosynthesis